MRWQGVKKKLTALWVNKNLVKKNFIKYVEQYRTLAKIVNYSNKVHINKMKEVIPDFFFFRSIIYYTERVGRLW